MEKNMIELQVYLKNGNILSMGEFSAESRDKIMQTIERIRQSGVSYIMDTNDGNYQTSYYLPSEILKIVEVGSLDLIIKNDQFYHTGLEEIKLEVYENDELINSYNVLGHFKAREHAGYITGQGYRYIENDKMIYISKNGILRVVFDDPKDVLSKKYKSKEENNEDTD